MIPERQAQALWWLIPDVVAGMSEPFIHPDRRAAGGGALNGFDDDLPDLHAAGIRAVVSLLNRPDDGSLYEAAGFRYLCLPIQEGGAPTIEQADQFVFFTAEQRRAGRSVAVHCEAGIGRTGTLLGTYLIALGDSASQAIRRVRAVKPHAIESPAQMDSLQRYEEWVRANSA